MTVTDNRKFVFYLFPVVIFLFSLLSCKLTLLPPYSKELVADTESAARVVDEFYLSMLEKAPGGQRPYANYIDHYIGIEVQLNSLYLRNRVRPLNKESARNCEITLKIWREYKEDHKKKNDLSDGIIRLNMKTMADLFYTIQVAEKAKE